VISIYAYPELSCPVSGTETLSAFECTFSVNISITIDLNVPIPLRAEYILCTIIIVIYPLIWTTISQCLTNVPVLSVCHSFSSQKINCMSVNKTILAYSDAPTETIEISSFNTVLQHCCNVSSFLLCRIHLSTNSAILFIGHCVLSHHVTLYTVPSQ